MFKEIKLFACLYCNKKIVLDIGVNKLLPLDQNQTLLSIILGKKQEISVSGIRGIDRIQWKLKLQFIIYYGPTSTGPEINNFNTLRSKINLKCT
jgi:hypothetical protein